MGRSYVEKYCGLILVWRLRLGITFWWKIIFGATPNIVTHYGSSIPYKWYMLGTVDSFNGGEEVCTKIVGPDFRMKITARLRLAIG